MSKELLPLGRLALGLGIDSVRVGRPFVVLAVRVPPEGPKTLHWVVDVTAEAGTARARHEVASAPCQRYAIVAHEDIRDRDGVLRPAVVAEVGDREHEDALRIAQPYVPFTGPDAPLELVGNPMMLGDTTNVLLGPAAEPGKPASFVVVCPKCRKRNRVSLARARERLPKCGACAESLLSA